MFTDQVATTRGAEAVEALSAAASAVGLRMRSPSVNAGSDLILIYPHGEEIPIDIKRASLVSIDTVDRQMAQWRSSRKLSSLRVIVADRITEGARQALREAGWSRLDLRGHVHLVSDGLFVDAGIPSLRREAAPPKPLAGQAAQEVAALLLLDPGRSASVRDIARVLGRSASTVSQAIRTLRDASLVEGQRQPATLDLF